MTWNFETSGLDGQCDLFGVNIFQHPWHRTGEVAHVLDPHYGQPRVLPVYQVVLQGRAQRFAAGEFSNGVWGFYLPARP